MTKFDFKGQASPSKDNKQFTWKFAAWLAAMVCSFCGVMDIAAIWSGSESSPLLPGECCVPLLLLAAAATIAPPSGLRDALGRWNKLKKYISIFDGDRWET